MIEAISCLKGVVILFLLTYLNLLPPNMSRCLNKTYDDNISIQYCLIKNVHEALFDR